jgi:sulfur carrier protein
MLLVNGESQEWKEGMTVRDMLKARNFIFPLLIVTVDGMLVQRTDYDQTVLHDGANIRVVHLMSGG